MNAEPRLYCYISAMRKLLLMVPLLALLAAALWFAVYTWSSLEGPPLPAFAYWAMAGGIGLSLLIGCGVMALVFYISRHGYDDLPGVEEPRERE